MRGAGRVLLVGVIATLAACAAPTGRTDTANTARGPGEAARAPKVLTLAIQNETKGFISELTLENTRVGGVRQPRPIVHNLLTVENDRAQFLPELATEQISIDKGTWSVNPDRTMVTTWRIRPNVRWHDGAPFTTDDLLFAFNVFTDPQVPSRVGPAARLMTSASAPDAHTLVVHWSAPFVGADAAPGLIPLPRHLMEETYLSDRAGIGNSPRLSTEFVGLGPYRLVNWEPGSHVEFARFDDYWRGRPPLDRVVVKFVGDPNTMVASILADAVDVVLPPAVDNETALEVKQRWQGTGHQVLIGPRLSLRILDPQQRPEYARPANGFVHSAVRKAFYHAIDRHTLTEVLTQGTAPIADSWILPGDAVRPRVESAIPQYPFDLARAQRQLAESGWAPGGDGVLVYGPTGERFEVELNGTSQRRVEQELNIIADGWKQIGAQVSFHAIPPAFGADVEYRSTRPGPTVLARSSENFRVDYLHTRNIPTAQNRWVGNTYSGYSNPRVDALLDQLVVTVNPAERIPLETELLREVMGDVPMWPLYWDMTNVLALRHVKGIPTGGGDYHTWNFFEWDREQ